MFDYLIVGAGLYGATCARTLADAGKSVKVIERRGHIAGNCYDENWSGCYVNRYGDGGLWADGKLAAWRHHA